jgi:hypothetical protein
LILIEKYAIMINVNRDQRRNSMEFYNSFNELAARTGQAPACCADMSVFNSPHIRLGNSDVFLDFHTEDYYADREGNYKGIIPDKVKAQELYNKLGWANTTGAKFYGKMSPEFASKHGFDGNVLVFDGDKLNVYDTAKGNAPIAGIELPVGWEKVAEVHR